MTSHLAAGPPVVLIAGAPHPSPVSELGNDRYGIAHAHRRDPARAWLRCFDGMRGAGPEPGATPRTSDGSILLEVKRSDL